jgi:uncharacterized protein YndB with AHSA1/START domain
MTGEIGRPEVVRQIHIAASPATVFSLLTDARRMTTWLAEIVVAEPVPGGTFRISEAGGLAIEGKYLEVVPDRRVVFSWGGIEGLKPGETIVDITLEADGDGTLLTLRHYGLPAPSIESHDKGWQFSALPKLKAAAEGRDPGGLCLGDLAHAQAGR